MASSVRKHPDLHGRRTGYPVLEGGSMATSHMAIAARGLRKAFGTQAVLDGIDVQVPQGTVFALLGPNGAGKTTMVQILSTLLAPDGGDARVAGHDLGR